jgi:hypothetical protein
MVNRPARASLQDFGRRGPAAGIGRFLARPARLGCPRCLRKEVAPTPPRARGSALLPAANSDARATREAHGAMPDDGGDSARPGPARPGPAPREAPRTANCGQRLAPSARLDALPVHRRSTWFTEAAPPTPPQAHRSVPRLGSGPASTCCLDLAPGAIAGWAVSARLLQLGGPSGARRGRPFPMGEARSRDCGVDYSWSVFPRGSESGGGGG